MSWHWATVKEAGALNGMRFMAWVRTHIGQAAFNVALVPVMAYFFVRRGNARRSSIDFFRRVRRCYPEEIGNRSLAWLSFRHFLGFGQVLLDKYLAWVETPSDIPMSQPDSTLLHDAVASGRGCLLIGSHFGNLEYSRGIATRHPGLVMNVLMYDQHATKFAALIGESAPISRMNLIQVTDLDFNLALRLKEKVQRGEWVVIAGDRVPVGEGGRVSWAKFFGEPARFPIGPYVLASLLRCPVYLIHCFRDEGEYRLRMEHFASEIRPSRENRQQAYDKEAQRFAEALERQVAQAPLQWFNFFDFWSDGEPSENPSGKAES